MGLNQEPVRSKDNLITWRPNVRGKRQIPPKTRDFAKLEANI